VNQVESVVDDVAESARGQRDAGELAVDGVEKSHDAATARPAEAAIEASASPPFSSRRSRAESKPRFWPMPQAKGSGYWHAYPIARTA